MKLLLMENMLKHMYMEVQLEHLHLFCNICLLVVALFGIQARKEKKVEKVGFICKKSGMIGNCIVLEIFLCLKHRLFKKIHNKWGKVVSYIYIRNN